LRERETITPLEKAMAILQSDYKDSLNREDTLKAISLFENITKATIFITLKGSVWDAWLSKEALLCMSTP